MIHNKNNNYHYYINNCIHVFIYTIFFLNFSLNISFASNKNNEYSDKIHEILENNKKIDINRINFLFQNFNTKTFSAIQKHKNFEDVLKIANQYTIYSTLNMLNNSNITPHKIYDASEISINDCFEFDKIDIYSALLNLKNHYKYFIHTYLSNDTLTTLEGIGVISFSDSNFYIQYNIPRSYFIFNIKNEIMMYDNVTKNVQILPTQYISINDILSLKVDYMKKHEMKCKVILNSFNTNMINNPNDKSNHKDENSIPKHNLKHTEKENFNTQTTYKTYNIAFSALNSNHYMIFSFIKDIYSNKFMLNTILFYNKGQYINTFHLYS